MTPQHTTSQIRDMLSSSRAALELVAYPDSIPKRKKMANFPLDDAAFVHRIFELFFYLRIPEISEQLPAETQSNAKLFWSAFQSLPWRAIASHQHISTLEQMGQLFALSSKAERLIRDIDSYEGNNPKERSTVAWRQLIDRIRQKSKPNK